MLRAVAPRVERRSMRGGMSRASRKPDTEGLARDSVPVWISSIRKVVLVIKTSPRLEKWP